MLKFILKFNISMYLTFIESIPFHNFLSNILAGFVIVLFSVLITCSKNRKYNTTFTSSFLFYFYLNDHGSGVSC